jgi:hypothetical protein
LLLALFLQAVGFFNVTVDKYLKLVLMSLAFCSKGPIRTIRVENDHLIEAPKAGPDLFPLPFV